MSQANSLIGLGREMWPSSNSRRMKPVQVVGDEPCIAVCRWEREPLSTGGIKHLPRRGTLTTLKPS